MHSFVLAQGAQKLSAIVKIQGLFFFGNLHIQTSTAGNFSALLAKTKLYTSFESADVWY